MVASARRIGWKISQGRCIRTDLDEPLDCLLDPPLVIGKVAQGGLWRLKQMGKLLTGLIPDEPDLVVQPPPGVILLAGLQDIVIDFVDVFGNRLSHKGSSCKTFDFCS